MIGLMDCNNFFVSCERLFRPDLVGKPVAVLSSNDGCIVARSKEVKDLGIPMGAPYFEVKEVCVKNNVVLFSTNLTLYRDISTRVMQALRAEFSSCEVYSVDEAFFEVDDHITEAELHAIRSRIMQKTGIPVSIGVAKTKTLAKSASSMAKKESGVCMLNEVLWEKTKPNMRVGSVWGIGRQTAQFLSNNKIYTVAELLAQDRSFIRNALGVMGERLCLELSGISVFHLGERHDEEQQSYSSTRSFAKPTHEKMTLMSALGHHIAHVAEKLRRDGCTASRLSIIARGSRYGAFAHRTGSAHVILTLPTNDTITLTQEVSKLLDTIYDAEIPYKKAGVFMTGIEQVQYQSGSLFSIADDAKQSQKLGSVFDTVNDRFGSGTLRTGVTLGAEKWKSERKLLSREYTTKWSEIASVKAV